MISRNIIMLMFLYFVQGLPHGFQAGFLPLFLHEKGQSVTSVSLMKFLFAPWICKVLWAPFIDRYMTKRKWLICSMSGLVATCLFGANTTSDQIILLCTVLFFLNIFAATQDIAVDGLAIKILHADELGQGNTAQVVGYKLGSMFGGGVLIWLNRQMGWTGLFFVLAVVYLEAIAFVYVSPSLRKLDLAEVFIRTKHENAHSHRCSAHGHEFTCYALHPSHKHTHHSHNLGKDNCESENEKPTQKIFNSLKDIITVPGTKWMILFLIFVKQGEQGALNMLPLFLIGRKVSSAELGFWTGMIGQVVSICGSLLGGLLVSNLSMPPQLLLKQLAVCRLLPLGAQLLVITVWTPTVTNTGLLYGVAVVSYCFLMFVSGTITTVTFTFMMHCSRMAPASIQATHFTALATVEVLGKIVFISVVGFLVDSFGYQLVFLLFIILCVILVPILNRCPRELLTEFEIKHEDSDCDEDEVKETSVLDNASDDYDDDTHLSDDYLGGEGDYDNEDHDDDDEFADYEDYGDNHFEYDDHDHCDDDEEYLDDYTFDCHDNLGDGDYSEYTSGTLDQKMKKKV